MKNMAELFTRFAPLFAMAAFAAVSTPAAADHPAMPGGSWQQTCQDASVRDGTLHARCRQENGQYRSASAQLLSNCKAYGNRNGQLFCETQGNAQANSRWNGSYAQSCSDISVDKHGRLSATCRKANGKSNRSNITPQQCPSYWAGNTDGKLVCEPQRSASSRWNGSFQKSCRDITMNSIGTLTATCQARNGNWQRTSLAAVNCNNYRADNDNGHLVCESQRVGINRWNGSFEKSCRDIYMNSNGTLTATCQTSSGSWRPTTLSAVNCNSYRADNNNGQLVCESQATAGKVWEGSFQKSCRNITTNSAGTLTANCRTSSGNWQRTSLAPGNCSRRQAGNNNGQLVCESQAAASNRWNGSFQKSCRDIAMNWAGTLTASCQTSSGNWQRTSLAPDKCTSYRAGNNNGHLVCESQATASNRWDGSFQKSCRDISTDVAGALTATCQTMNGNWQRSSLGARQCNSARAGNNNGQLVCES